MPKRKLQHNENKTDHSKKPICLSQDNPQIIGTKEGDSDVEIDKSIEQLDENEKLLIKNITKLEEIVVGLFGIQHFLSKSLEAHHCILPQNNKTTSNFFGLHSAIKISLGIDEGDQKNAGEETNASSCSSSLCR